MADVVVVGAGVVGSSIAFHLAELGARVLVIDRDGPVAGSTARSGGIVACGENTVIEADLAWESLTGYFEHWGERVGGGCGFTRTGHASLVGEADAEALRTIVAMHKAAVGIDTELLAAQGLAEAEPAAYLGDVRAAEFQPRGGYADPSATALSLLRAGIAKGVSFERRRAVGLRESGDRVVGVSTDDGDVDAGAVVLAAGAWSVPLAATIGVELPVRPTRVQVMLFERPYTIPMHLTMTDAVNDLYVRSTADRCTLAGREAPDREWLDDADAYKHDLDDAAVTDVAGRLAKRFPDLAAAPYRLGRTGVLDMTVDGKPVLGPLGRDGLYAAVGWSGSGFGKAPAIGAEIARWVAEGAPRRTELKDYHADRFHAGTPIRGDAQYASTGHRLGW